MNSLKQSLVNHILSSTIHGIPKIFLTDRLFNKILWIVCTIVSTAVCAWFILESLFAFADFDHITQVETIYEQPTEFITVQFCSQDKTSFNKKDLKKGELLIQCIFNYDTACLENPGHFFEAYNDPTYNRCFRFNSGKNLSNHSIPILSSTIGGKDDSFIMEIYAPKGLVVWIHNHSTPPKRLYKNDHNGDTGFASTGFVTHFVAEKTVDTKLEEPYNKCFKDVSLFEDNKTVIDYILNKPEVYSQVNCLELCFDLEFIELNPCNCTKAILGKVWKNCYGLFNKLVNISECTFKYKMNWYKQNLAEKYTKYCPLECDSISYLVSNRHLSNVVKKTNVLIYAYYRTLKYTLITQQPKMLKVDLISYIGGICGLFLGSSFLSFIEIFEFILEFVFFLINK